MDKKLVDLYHYLTITMLIIGAIIIVAIIIVYFNYAGAIVKIFKTFELSQQVKNYLYSLISGGFISNLIWIVPSGIAFFSIFEYIKRKKAFAFIEGGTINRAGLAIFIFSFLNFIVLIPLLLYLIFIKGSILEFISVLSSFLISLIIFIPLGKSYLNVLYNYDLISELNGVNTSKNKQNSSLILQSLPKVVINLVIQNAPEAQSAIFASTIFVIGFGLAFNFNIISIVYLVLTFLYWFSFISIISSGFPKQKSKISFLDGTEVKNFYIIEDNPDGYYLIVNHENKIQTVFKNTIKIVTPE